MAKDLVDNAKALVAGAASNQEHLMSAANTITETIARMADCVKLGAASLGSHQPDAQVTLSLSVSHLSIFQMFIILVAVTNIVGLHEQQTYASAVICKMNRYIVAVYLCLLNVSIQVLDRWTTHTHTVE